MKYLIVSTYSPTNNFFAEESLELILSIASLENHISVLFLQNAAFQLLSNSQYETIERSLLAQTIQAFELFAITNIYIEELMLKKIHNLNLVINPNINFIKFNLNNLNNLYNNHDVILWY